MHAVAVCNANTETLNKGVPDIAGSMLLWIKGHFKTWNVFPRQTNDQGHQSGTPGEDRKVDAVRLQRGP
jgi:hypothetical protein